MALADYYHRDAVAISQVLRGYDETAIRQRVDSVTVGLGFARSAAESFEGRALLDLLVRIAARLYPALVLDPMPGCEEVAGELQALALSINPAIDLSGRKPTVGIWVGPDGRAMAPTTLFAGSSGWKALFSSRQAVTIGDSTNPLGAGASACLAAANLFRHVFSESADLDVDVEMSTLPDPLPTIGKIAGTDIGGLVLVGVGAIGNAAVWALARSGVQGDLHLVDHERIELGNLQRYVLTSHSDVGRPKVDVAADYLVASLAPKRHQNRWDAFVASGHHRLQTVLVGVDSASDRRAVQAALPEWIANAWTQPGDLGVSAHQFDGTGACLACLYLPAGKSPSEDTIIAEALRIPDQVMEVRVLLRSAAPVPTPLLEMIADRLGVERQLVLGFEGNGIRSLYVEGICGGAVLPLGYAGTPRQDVHVPLAHQSALAGILLSARALGHYLRRQKGETLITRVNLMGRVYPAFMTQPISKDPRGICICQDPAYLTAYRNKYERAA